MEKSRLEGAIALMSKNTGLENSELRTVLVDAGYSTLDADLIVCFVPIAFGRPILEHWGVTRFSGTVSVPRRNGRWVDVPMSEVPIYVEALSIAREQMKLAQSNPAPYGDIALRSAEVRAVGEAIKAGEDVHGAVVASAALGPPYAEDLGYGSVLSRIFKILRRRSG